MVKHTGKFVKKIILFIILFVILFGYPVKQVAAAPSNAEKTPQFSISRGEALLQAADCSTQTDLPLAECQALVALYSQTNGASWTNHTGWLQDNAPCSWFGVTCSGGHVTRLSLPHNQLVGAIPAELGSLPYLQNLTLSQNQLTGSIPDALGSLVNLQYLYLSSNQLSGAIPAALGSLVNLQYLYLSSNQLNGAIPSALGSLANLRYLYLDNNQFSGSIPAALGSLTGLRTLNISTNQLSGSIPDELGSLTNLTVLLLGSNQLSGSLPVSLGSLANLQNMNLSSNQLSDSLPASFGNLVNLENLYIANNRLSGPIPGELGSLAKVRIVELYGNQLSGAIPPQLGNLANITNLLLGHNLLSGTVPAELGNLVNLDHLSLVDNPLYGSIPLSFINLTNLSIFRFYSTSLCEPTSAEFLAWKATVTTWLGTSGCSAKISPTNGQVNLPVNLSLSWGSTATPVTRYEFCYDTSDNDACATTWINNGLNTTASLSGLSRNTTYYWQVRWYTGTDDPHYTDSGEWWSFTIIPYSPVAFNKDFPVVDATVVATNPTLTWDASTTPGVSYAVCYDSVDDDACAGDAWHPVTAGTSYALSGLGYNTTYYWQVRASNAGGDTYADTNTWWSFTTMHTPPAAFTKNAPANGDPSQPPNLTLEWFPSDPGVTYAYCISLSSGACESEEDWVTASGTSAAPTGLSFDTTYYWQVRARNSENTITYADSGNWWSFTTYSQPPVGFVKNSPENNAANQPLNPTLSWLDAGAGFTYEYCVSQGAPFTCGAGWTPVAATSVQVGGLANAATYSWQVRARDSSGHTTDANALDANPIWQFSTRPVPPASSDVTYNNIDEDQSVADDLPGANEMIFAPYGVQPAGTLTLTGAGHFTYQPPLNFIGEVQFQFTVTDGINDPSGPYTVTIHYISVNDPPVLDPIPDITIHSGEVAAFTPSAGDPDLPPGGQLTFSIDPLPAGASFDTSSGVFQWLAFWQPGASEYTLTVTVSDGVPTDHPVQQTVTITVLPLKIYLPAVAMH